MHCTSSCNANSRNPHLLNSRPGVLWYVSSMRKTTFVNAFTARTALFCIASFIAAATPSFAQDAPTALPADPKELMLLAAKVNNLTESDMPPWHLKATYKLLDEKGNTTDQGTYEESWASPTKFKCTFTGAAYTQTDYGTDKGVLRSGSRQDLAELLLYVRREFANGLPSKQEIANETLSLQKIETNGTSLSCLHVTAPIADQGFTYCLDANKPILRISTKVGQPLQAIHNRILEFQGHSIAGDLDFIRDGKPVLTAHLENIEALSPLNEADFTPTSDAVLLPRRVRITAGMPAPVLLKHQFPLYPAGAKRVGVAGTVVIRVVIDIDGRVSNLSIVSGPPELQQAAMDAVRTWQYKPYLMNGEPVEVLMTIHVAFTLGG